MTKIVAIGDVHGRDTWKKIVEKEKDADRIVFIGDYFDSFDIKPVVQIENFIDIYGFKRQNPEKVVMLLGNHDFHYMKDSGDDRYSGYNAEWAREITLNLQVARFEIQVVHVEGKYLFSHAGVTNSWLIANPLYIENINNMDWEAFRFNHNDLSGFGNDKRQSPIWVRPQALIPDAHLDYTQVVGHTKQPGVTYYEGEYPARLIMIDCHDTVDEYLVIEDGIPRTESV